MTWISDRGLERLRGVLAGLESGSLPIEHGSVPFNPAGVAPPSEAGPQARVPGLTQASVAERFEICERLGSGGMGAVYRALDRASGQSVAVKVLHAGERADVQRFLREAQVLAELSHPGIVRHVDHGAGPDGSPYLAMELLAGPTLREVIRERALPWIEALEIGLGMADALRSAHASGVVHRDIKPSNVLLVDGRTDRVKLLDFGVARWARTQAAKLTSTGALVGTPGYMAPEQARGAGDSGEAVDVFSLGCVLHECVTGRPAFAAEDLFALLAKILLEDVPSLIELGFSVPPALDALLSAMLAKSPARRPNMPEVAETLAALIAGAAPSASAPPAAPKLTHSERRVLCVVMGRVVANAAGAQGAATLESAGSSATDAGARTGPPEQWLAEAARSFGARIEPLGGRVVALLADVEVATDQAVIAAQAALAMRRACPAAAIAVATGRGVLQAAGAIGEAIDRCARVLAATPAGAVGIDSLTAELIGARFVVDAADDAPPDVANVRRHRLIAERDPTEQVRRLLGRRTAFVGRDREMFQLESLFEECASEPIARVALITAPAGAGKSRLAHELIRRLRRRRGLVRVSGPRADRALTSDELDTVPASERTRVGGHRVEVWLGRAERVSAGSPFGVIGGLVRAAAGVQVGEPPELAQAKLRARVRERLDDEGDAIAAFIGELAGVPFDDEAIPALRAARRDPLLMGDRRSAAWEAFLAAECEAHPVLMVIEDLHWGDRPSIDLLDQALCRLAHGPLMVVAVARPEVHDLFPRLWESRGVESMVLRALTRSACTQLVKDALGASADEATVAGVIERAGGNPFCLEELVRAVAAGASGLPDTVLAMVGARLGRLDPAARRVLRAASVFGRVFWVEGVAALLDESLSGRVADWLAVLRDAELVVPSKQSQVAGQIQHEFQHALVRDAAYDMLTDDDRALGHRLAGAWLMRVGADAVDAVEIGEHLERGGDTTGACEAYHRGAHHALVAHDFAAVLYVGARALDCGVRGGADPALLGTIHRIRAEAHRWRGDTEAALEDAARASEHLPSGAPEWFQAAGEAAAAHGRMGAYEHVERWCARMCAALADLPQSSGSAPAIGWVAGARDAAVSALCPVIGQLLQGGRVRAAEAAWAHLSLRVDGAAPLGPGARGRVAQLAGFRALRDGTLGTCVETFGEAVEAFASIGDLRTASLNRVNLGFVFAQLGAPARAEVELRLALEAAERLRLHPLRAYALLNLGRVHLLEGRADLAEAPLSLALELGRAEQSRRIEGAARLHRSTVALAANDPHRAAAEASLAIELLAATPPLLAPAHAAHARALARLGRAEEALAHADQATALMASAGREALASLVRVARVEALLTMGQTDEARRALDEAVVEIETAAEALTDSDLRHGFLWVVPESATLLRMAGRAP